MKNKKESSFQSELIRDIQKIFPSVIVLKNDPSYLQGIPDLLVLGEQGKWASLECKRNMNASGQPNQKYYVDKMNAMSFSRVVYPENKEEVLSELKGYFD